MDSFKSIMISNSLAVETKTRNNNSKNFHINTKHSKKIMAASMYRSRKLINSESFRQTTSLPEKAYPNASQELLPKIDFQKDKLSNILANRKSQLIQPVLKKLTLDDLSYLCWATYGKNAKGTRNAPSGGALYPCELYLIVINADVSKGIYHYRPDEHLLEKINDDIPDMSEYLMVTNGFENTSVIFVTSLIFDRTTFKYGDRGYRYALLEAGAMGQNLSLMATNLGLIATSFGGTSDVEIEKLLGIDGLSESMINCVLINSDME
ncbi:SagB family peptide dehydrogenase [Priestia aryabhattai]|uniref:SagB family peptide dehydrogenase n=1 Tax=Priestia TaxID=2800373 RepID=UPI001C8D76D5|nr:SagB family peptide dehydrogenase [Priestia aryabhattai]MBX9971350.1 SagB family peptide dehydrogenase [Priestia aryabhattai]